MNKNDENLEGLVKKLKERGIDEGNAEKKKIIEAANNQADEIIAQANAEAQKITAAAQQKAQQLEKNANAALKQAFRDTVGATEVALLKFLKSVFGTQTQKAFDETKYMQALVEATVSQINGNKTLLVTADKLNEMQQFIVAKALAKTVELKPLPQADTKIVIQSNENSGINFSLTPKDVENALFELLNPELVKRIKKQEEA